MKPVFVAFFAVAACAGLSPSPNPVWHDEARIRPRRRRSRSRWWWTMSAPIAIRSELLVLEG